ncbi:MAG: hypothetical protein AAB426_14235, partial [Myxococcota bacterium]
WTEEHSQATYGAGIAVRVVAGRFSVELGSRAAFPPTLFDNNELYLAMSVRRLGDATWVALAGSQRLLAVPYAVRGAADADFRVGGRLTVGENATVTGVVTPSTGNLATRGIQFPNLGTSDAAVIRYYLDTGDDTVLRIGSEGDATDRIGLYQGGVERLTVRNGRVGVAQTNPSTTLHVGGNTQIDGTITSTGAITTAGPLNVVSSGSPGIEVRSSAAGTPYIDFANDSAANYDARIILTADDVLEVQGADMRVSGYGLTVDGRLNVGSLVVTGLYLNNYDSSSNQTTPAQGPFAFCAVSQHNTNPSYYGYCSVGGTSGGTWTLSSIRAECRALCF